MENVKFAGMMLSAFIISMAQKIIMKWIISLLFVRNVMGFFIPTMVANLQIQNILDYMG